MFGHSADFYRGQSSAGTGHWSDKLRHSSAGNVDMSEWEEALAQARAERTAARVERDVALRMMENLLEKLRLAMPAEAMSDPKVALRKLDELNSAGFVPLEHEHGVAVDQALANYKLRLVRQPGHESRVIRTR